jgi:sialic acid synthase SpsE
LTKHNVRAIRPGLGLPTKYLGMVLGKAVKQAVKCGTALSWELI